MLLIQVAILVDRYASQDAYEQALSKAESTDAPAAMKVKCCPSWTSSSHGVSSMVMNMEVPSSQDTNAPSLPNESVPMAYQETDKFDGDWVLANSILFLQDFNWWMELAFAVPEGDIGRVFEILKVSNFG